MKCMMGNVCGDIAKGTRLTPFGPYPVQEQPAKSFTLLVVPWTLAQSCHWARGAGPTRRSMRWEK